MLKLPTLELYKFKFTFQVLDEMDLPEYKGSMFRGVFGWTFKKLVCINRNIECSECLLKNSCIYVNIFETESLENKVKFLKGVKKLPHPFIIHPPLGNDNILQKDDLFALQITIFGDAIRYIPYFVYTMQKIGEMGISYKRSKFRLTRVESISPKDVFTEVYDPFKSILAENYSKIVLPDILSEEIYSKNTIKIEFLTPAKLQTEGKVISDKNRFNPELLIKAIERRYFALCNLYSANTDMTYPLLNLDECVILLENNLVFKHIDRYSNRQQRKLDIGGLLGDFTLKGDIERIYHLLRIGEYINIGKNTLFGLGEYKITIGD